MPSMKYRSVKTPPVCGSISLKDSINSARVVRRNAKAGSFIVSRSDRPVGSLLSQRIQASKTATKVSDSIRSKSKTKAVGKR